MKYVVMMVLLLGSLSTYAVEGFYKIPDISSGKISSRGDKKLLYKYTRTVTNEGDNRVVKRLYEDTNGKAAAAETVSYSKEGKVLKFVYEQFQVNTHGSFVIEGDKVLFSFTKDGKTKTDDEKLEDNFICSDQVVEYLYKNWDALMQGKTIHIRFPVIFRTETVGFKFFKEAENEDTIRIKMKPSSFVIAALVDPLVFVIQKKGDHRTLLVDGRVTPKIQVDGKWKDLDALFTFDY